MDERITCAKTDGIEVLGFGKRVHNALKRADINTVGGLIALDDEQLFSIHNLGEKGVAKIKEQLSKVDLLDAPLPAPSAQAHFPWAGEAPVMIDLGPPKILRHEVVEWQKMALSRQISAGTLHPQLQIDDYTLAELVDVHSYTAGLYETLRKILSAPVSVSQELERVLGNVSERALYILIHRFGFDWQTLEIVAAAFEISRERARQIHQKTVGRVRANAGMLLLLRVRSAILYANDIELSFDDWSQRLVRTGLLGEWTAKRFVDLDPFELLIAICKLLEATEDRFEIPESLNYMIRLHCAGKSSTPARVLELSDSFSNEMKRLVKRHLGHSGAVSLDWLANQDVMDFEKSDLRLILEFKGFFAVDENWYMSRAYMPENLEKDSVLHRSLLKMFQYCGPLDIRNVYFGIEHTLSKTDFPIPPIDVLEQLLSEYGYCNESGLWHWRGEMAEELNSGERAIWDVINKSGGAAHHFELMQSIIARRLSGANLGATVSRSPLFDNFERGLYKIRGTKPTAQAVERARFSASRVPVNLSVERDTFGNIIVAANLGIQSIANGTVISERLPSLSGIWSCCWGDGEETELRVTHNEIRGLLNILRYLECEVGDRIAIRFNVFDRSATVTKVGA